MADKNIFGGGNPNSLYTPMSEDEREVLQRLIDNDDLEIHVKGWGVVNKFIEKPRFGDLRLQLKFRVRFSSPPVEIPVRYFDLELRTRSGILLFKEKQPVCEPDGSPLYVKEGVMISLAWDIGIQKMDPKLVKAIKPGARGLTTREGNRKLKSEERKLLSFLRDGEKKVRAHTRKQVREAEKKSILQYED